MALSISMFKIFKMIFVKYYSEKKYKVKLTIILSKYDIIKKVIN